MNFYEKDELGIEREYLVITEYEFHNNDYVIYTDLVFDYTKNLRLFAGRIINNTVVRVNEAEEKLIICAFKEDESIKLKELEEKFL